MQQWERGRHAHEATSQVVREIRQDLASSFGHDDEVLEPTAAEAAPVAARLERDHVADHELVAEPAEVRAPVDLEPDAVAEPVEVAVLELLTGRLGQQRGLAGLVVGLARALEQRAAVDAGAD